MDKITVKIAKTPLDIKKAYGVRELVFMEEQGVSREEEMDEFDGAATHIIAYYDDEVAGCARIRFLGNKSKLERIAVLLRFRKKGIGKKIVDFLVAYSKEKGATEAVMHAQIYANDFYVKCGFKPRGEEFMEANIRHVEMYMEL